MNLSYPDELIPSPNEVLRKAGYSYSVDPVTQHSSYMLRLGPDLYPRFHVYVEHKDGETILSLHLDQKKPSYSGSHAHGGEYDGPIIEKEMKRIDDWVRYFFLASSASNNF